jgi:triosephosphate isomerase
MRTPVIAANWKMNKTQAAARQFLADFLPRVAGLEGVELIICPPFTALAAVAEGLRGSRVGLGAQNMSEKDPGAYTGEVAGEMLVEAGCRYVILGHSERRHIYGETDQLVGAKVRTAVRHGLIPILCIGETLEEREAGKTDAVNRRQLLAGLEGLTAGEVAGAIIAYEPVWAIGTGKNCDPGEAQRTIAAVRAMVAEAFGADAAAQVRIQYGGSVKPGNIGSYMAQPDIDGALVGGASLDPASFAEICAAAR